MILVKGLQKYQRSNLEVEKTSSAPGVGTSVSNPAESAIFFQPPTLTSNIFAAPWQPLHQNECLVPHLKDLFHICLEPEVQGHGTTFTNVIMAQSDPFSIGLCIKCKNSFTHHCLYTSDHVCNQSQHESINLNL